MRLSSPEKRPWNRTALLAGLGFAASWAISSAFSYDPAYSARGMFSLLDAFFLFVMVQDAPVRPEFWRRLGMGLLLGLGLVGLDALTQTVWGTSLLSGRLLKAEEGGRTAGPFSNANILSLICSYLPSIWLLKEVKAGSVLRGKGVVVFGIVALVLGGSALYFSHSRNAWLGAGLFLISALWFLWRWRGIAAGAVLVAALAIATPTGQALWERARQDVAKPTVRSRLEFWPKALGFWTERPWLGTGPRMFDRSWPRSNEEAVEAGWERWIPPPHHPHNIFLEALMEEGVLGLAALILFVGYALWVAWGLYRKQPQLGRARFAATGLTLLLVVGMFDFSMHMRVYAYSLFFFCGLIAALSAGKSAEPDASR